MSDVRNKIQGQFVSGKEPFPMRTTETLEEKRKRYRRWKTDHVQERAIELEQEIACLRAEVEELREAFRLLTGPALFGAMGHEEIRRDFGEIGLDNFVRAWGRYESAAREGE
jgi:hypothetical protein